MISPTTPLGTPGFFEQPAFPFPAGSGLLPGTLPQEGLGLPLSGADQQNYVKNIMAEMMVSMREIQLNFAKYLGNPTGI